MVITILCYSNETPFITIIDVTLEVWLRNNSHGNTPVLIDNHLVEPWTIWTVLWSLSLFNVTFSAMAYVIISIDWNRCFSAFCRWLMWGPVEKSISYESKSLNQKLSCDYESSHKSHLVINFKKHSNVQPGW